MLFSHHRITPTIIYVCNYELKIYLRLQYNRINI